MFPQMKVFGSLGPTGYFTEETPYAPNSPYSASKASSDHFVRAYFHTYGLPTVITNCSNNYGPYQFPEKLIPLMILNALSGKSLPVYGDGSNVRDWIYVDDHCRGVKLAFEKGSPRRGICHRRQQRAEEPEPRPPDLRYPRRYCTACGSPGTAYRGCQLQGTDPFRDGPAGTRQTVRDQFEQDPRELGWQPEVGFEAGLRRTIEWYLTNPKWVEQAGGGSYSEWIEKNYAWRAGKEAK